MVRRRIYFSFDYKRDLYRVNQVRNMPDMESHSAAGFYSTDIWEKLLQQGNEAIVRQVISNMKNTCATVVCFTSNTENNRYVNYEIEESMRRKNVIIGLQIHHLRNEHGETDAPGNPPFILQTNGYKSYKFVHHESLQRIIAESLRLMNYSD